MIKTQKHLNEDVEESDICLPHVKSWVGVFCLTLLGFILVSFLCIKMAQVNEIKDLNPLKILGIYKYRAYFLKNIPHLCSSTFSPPKSLYDKSFHQSSKQLSDMKKMITPQQMT